MALDLAGALPNLVTVEPKVRRGETVLFEELYERYYTDVLRYSLVLTGRAAEAEDVAAEAFARALGAWNKGREPEGPPLAWLFAIARNVATDWSRRAGRAAARLGTRPSDGGQAEVESVVWLESLVRILPPRQREAIVLRYYRDLADADIGRLMGLSESGVRSLVARAMATLREHPEVWQ